MRCNINEGLYFHADAILGSLNTIHNIMLKLSMYYSASSRSRAAS